MGRREFLTGGAVALGAATLPLQAFAAECRAQAKAQAELQYIEASHQIMPAA